MDFKHTKTSSSSSASTSKPKSNPVFPASVSGGAPTEDVKMGSGGGGSVLKENKHEIKPSPPPPNAFKTVNILTRVEEAAYLGNRMNMLFDQDSVLNFADLPEEQRQNLHRRDFIPALELAYGVCPLHIQRQLPNNQFVIIDPNIMDRDLCAGDLAEL